MRSTGFENNTFWSKVFLTFQYMYLPCSLDLVLYHAVCSTVLLKTKIKPALSGLCQIRTTSSEEVLTGASSLMTASSAVKEYLFPWKPRQWETASSQWGTTSSPENQDNGRLPQASEGLPLLLKTKTMVPSTIPLLLKTKALSSK